MKIPFDIKFRPQIESGEYKLETECGHPVSIMDWEWIDRNENKCLAVKVLMDEGYNIGYLFDYDGKRHSIFPSDSDSDLFIITPEPELSEFEIKVQEILYADKPEYSACDQESWERASSELLELARKEIVKEIKEDLYTNKVNNAFGSKTTSVLQDAFNQVKSNALKDLPRWNNSRWIYEDGWLLDGFLYYKNHSIPLKDLEKLPGFNE